MNKIQQKENKASVLKYWFNIIFPKIRGDIWEYLKEHIALTLVILITTIAASTLSANEIINKAISEGYISDASSLVRTLFSLLILSLLYAAWGIIFYPAKIHNDKELEITNLKKALDVPRPQLIPDINGFDKLESAFPLWRGSVQTGDVAKRYFLSLQNIGKVDTGPVYATISFYKINCKEIEKLSHSKAFWFNDKPRVARSGKEVHVIRALSNPEGICLVIRKEGFKDLFVFNDDSYLSGTTGIVFKESLKIPFNKIYVCVKLIAQNLPENLFFWIKITNLGKEKPPKFELLDTPPC